MYGEGGASGKSRVKEGPMANLWGKKGPMADLWGREGPVADLWGGKD